MPEDRTFMMGKFPALLPGDLSYAPRNHMWCRLVNGRQRFGFTAYALRLMQDVYFLDWQVEAGDPVVALQEIGHIETSKAESDLFAPITGTLVVFNRELLKDPTPINLDNYGAGWLLEIDGNSDGLLDVSAYYEHLAANWERTQRLIKGKINEDP